MLYIRKAGSSKEIYFMGKESREKPLSLEEWYDTARAKVNTFLHGIDPGLQVEVKQMEVTPKIGKSYGTLVLFFSHHTDPRLRWSMSIEKSHDYIENRLEGNSRKIYKEKKEGK